MDAVLAVSIGVPKRASQYPACRASQNAGTEAFATAARRRRSPDRAEMEAFMNRGAWNRYSKVAYLPVMRSRPPLLS
jgi:hypothetical protein